MYIRASRWYGDFQSRPCLSLIRGVGVVNILILFCVLRTLPPAMKSSHSTDSEKGHSGKAFISRPLDGTKPLSRFPFKSQGQMTKSATPARLPGVSSFARSLFPFHKKSRSSSSSTHLLTREPPSRGHSPTSSLDRSDSSSSTLPFGKPVAPALNIELPVPPQIAQKSTQTVPGHLKIDLPSQDGMDSTGLSSHFQ